MSGSTARPSDREYGVIVIGGGVAGLTAARRAQQAGAEVIVFDKATEDQANTTRLSGGAFHAAYLDPRSHSPDELFAAILKETDGHARPDLARVWADNVLRGLDFLAAEGAALEKAGTSESHWNRIGPPPLVTRTLLDRRAHWKGGANDRLLKTMAERLVAEGGVYSPATRVAHLALDEGRVIGVHLDRGASGTELVRGRAVIMAGGGFQANRELVTRYVTPHTYSLLCSELETGDCLTMGLAIGAKAVELEAAYQWVVLRDRATHPTIAHPPSPTWLIGESMVVDPSGARFMDEALPTSDSSAGTGGYPQNQYRDKRMSGLISRSKITGDRWVIFDDVVWETTGRKTTAQDGVILRVRGNELPLNPTLVEHGGSFLSANSVGELAGQAGLPADRLQESVDAFNRFSRDGTPLTPPRSVRARPIERPPFHAVPIVAGIFYTMGGLLVNAMAQVLDTDERPIPGLYAAGGTMGGLQGGPRDGYCGGWSQATTFGLLAGEHAAASIAHAV